MIDYELKNGCKHPPNTFAFPQVRGAKHMWITKCLQTRQTTTNTGMFLLVRASNTLANMPNSPLANSWGPL